MAGRRVVVHFLSEPERIQAASLLSDVDATESFVVGTIEEARLPDLEGLGLPVREIEEAPPPPAPRAVAGGGIELATAFAAGPAGPAGWAPSAVQVLGVAGPVLPAWQRELEAAGVDLLERLPHDRYKVRLADGSRADAVRSLPFVRELRPYHPSEARPGPVRIARAAPGAVELAALAPAERPAFDVRVLSPADREAVQTWLVQEGAEVLAAGDIRLRIAATEDVAERARDHPGVDQVEEHVPAETYNDRARALVGGRPTFASESPPLVLEGEGEIVAVADTGVDDGHEDFAGRIHGREALGRPGPGDTSDPDGHGTHVAGTLLGSGAASNGAYRGVAPRARLYVQSLLDAGGRLGGIPLELKRLFATAYEQGARVHNDSWGADVRARYTFNSREVDEFVNEKRDMAIVFAAGNHGTTVDPPDADRHTPQGSIEWLSLGAPGTSKNAIVVGASRSDRTEGGYAQRTYGTVWSLKFPDGAVAGERVSGAPESLAGFSSRGPCEDRRIKPDLVAPGTDIASCKSSTAPLWKYWGIVPGTAERYAYMGGTSMAAPVVAGCATLVREYYRKVRRHAAPSASLIKATLVNGTRWLGGEDAIADHGRPPNVHQGFGCVHLPTTIPDGTGPLRLEFVDAWQDPGALLFRSTGQKYRFQVTAAAGTELRVCMAYTDPPASGLQNDLNLIVRSPSGARKWWGNEGSPFALKHTDTTNNVEIVRIAAPEAGAYTVDVIASNLPFPKTNQSFALVVTGALGSGLVRS